MTKSPIAQRLIPAAGDGRSRVTASLFAPERDEDGKWCCDYRISFPKRKVQRTAYGADSLQALMLALTGLQAEVVGAETKGEVQLDWQGSKFKVPSRIKAFWKPERK